MKFELILLDKFADIHREYLKLGNQMENTCGPYTLLYILRGLGFTFHKGIPITEDYLAYLARTRIAEEEAKLRREIFEKILRGEVSVEEAHEKYGKIMYTYELLTTRDPVEMGTSAQGVKHACEVVTEGKLAAIPIPSRRGEKILFTEERFRALTDLLISKVDEWKYQVIMNLQMARLLNPINPYHDIFKVLVSPNPEAEIGPSPWRVGHFLSLAGFIVVKDCPERKVFYILRDTYRNLGYKGYHVQPEEYVRRALVRDDGREGGLLIIVNKEVASAVEEEMKKIGLEVGLWNNGSPF